MSRPVIWRLITLGLVFLAVFGAVKYILPFIMPFLLGTGLALAAEPMVSFFSRRVRLPRGFAAVIGVTATILLLLGAIVLVGSVLVRELGLLAGVLPDLEGTMRQGLTSLEDFLLSLAARTPEGIRPMLTRMVLGLFSGGSALVEQVTTRLPAMVTGVLSHIPAGAVGIGTGLLSAFMISARLPKLKAWLKNRVPSSWRERYLPALRGVKDAIFGWLKAQLKLSGLTLLIVTAGLLVLGVPYAPVWAVGVALVDAIPILGTGTVLLPWALVCLLQGDTLRGIGLLGIYAIAALARSVLEPRLLGKQLGLDPLVTLIALYVGYQLWGILGMLLAPMLAMVAMQISQPRAGS